MSCNILAVTICLDPQINLHKFQQMKRFKEIQYQQPGERDLPDSIAILLCYEIYNITCMMIEQAEMCSYISHFFIKMAVRPPNLTPTHVIQVSCTEAQLHSCTEDSVNDIKD